MIMLVEILTVLGLVAAACSLLIAQPARSPSPRSSMHPDRSRIDPAQRVGRWLRSVARQDADTDRDRLLGRAVLASGVATVLSPVLGVTVFVALIALGLVRLSRAAKERDDMVAAGLSEVIDLFAVALLSGHNVAAATAQVGEWIDGPISDGFGWCGEQVAKGRSVADALEDLPAQLGSVVRPLVSALVANERHGAPIAAGLAQLAADHRGDQRRRAETAARRLPVHLLFPLIVCVLPAFLLLTVLPVVAETFSNLDVFGSP